MASTIVFDVGGISSAGIAGVRIELIGLQLSTTIEPHIVFELVELERKTVGDGIHLITNLTPPKALVRSSPQGLNDVTSYQ